MKYWFSILFISALVSCGSGAKAEKLRNHLTKAKTQIGQLEAMASPDQTDLTDLIKTVKADIERAEFLLIEDDFSQAETIINGAIAKMRPYVAGNSSTQKGGQEVKELTGELIRSQGEESSVLNKGDSFSQSDSLMTGIRSAAVLKLFSGDQMVLSDQSEITFLALEQAAGKIKLSLNRGGVTYEKKGDSGSVEIMIGNQRFSLSNKASFEIKLDPLGKRNFFALFEGNCDWKGQIEGQIGEKEALLWDDSGQNMVQIPFVPELESPSNHRVLNVPNSQALENVKFRWSSAGRAAGYQLQISSEPHFLTRLFDSAQVGKGSYEYELPIGTYYWRVRSISKDHIPGAFSSIKSFKIKESQDDSGSEQVELKGPRLDIKDIEIISSMGIVTGVSDSSAYVTVNGVKAVMNEDGSFRVIVNFTRSGEQDLEVVARFQGGGETVSNHRVKVNF